VNLEENAFSRRFSVEIRAAGMTSKRNLLGPSPVGCAKTDRLLEVKVEEFPVAKQA